MKKFIETLKNIWKIEDLRQIRGTSWYQSGHAG